MKDRDRWESRYNAPERVYGVDPSDFLRANIDHLPSNGLALDIAAGEGRNSIFLAERGIEVIALDISESALRKCLSLAREHGADVMAAVVDLTHFQIPKESFDVIIDFNYLERSLAAQIIDGLKSGGLLVFETMTKEQLRWKPDFNPEYLLDVGELPCMFKGLEIIKYSKRSMPSGDSFRCVASLIARKIR